MKLRVTQCAVGQYDLLSKTQSLSFYMGIFDDKNKLIEQDGVKALLHYSSDDASEIDVFEDALNNIEYTFKKCLDYSKNVWSTVNYTAQCLLFYKTYQENFEDIERNTKAERDAEIKKEIKHLQRQLESDMLVDLEYTFARYAKDQIAIIDKNIEALKIKNTELKEESASFTANAHRIISLQKEIENLKSLCNLPIKIE